MLEEELNIYDFDLSKPEDLDIPLTFCVSDFRNLETRNGNYSKTIRIPSTKRNDSLMASSFDITAEGYFDRNAKQRFKLERYGVLILKGYIQLKECIIENGYLAGYEIALFSDNAGFFINIKDISLRDLPYSQHEYNVDNIEASFANNGNNADYVYPMVDYGYLEARANNDSLPVEAWIPAFFIKRILKKIANVAGYLTDTDFFAKIPFRDSILLNPRDFGLSQEQVELLSFKVGMTTDQTESTAYGTPPAAPITPVVQYNKDTSPFFDNGSDFNTGTYVYTVDDSWFGSMIVQVKANLIIQLNSAAPSLWTVDTSPSWKIILYKNGVSVSEMELATTIGLSNSVLVTTQEEDHVFNLSYDNQTFTTGDTFFVQATINASAAAVETLAPPVGLSFRARITIDSTATETFWYNSPSSKILEGSLLQLNRFLPDWTQQDFIKALCQNFHLIIDSNEVAKTVKFFTRDEYFYDISQAVNWTSKIDISKGQRIVQIEDGINKIFHFKYKEDRNDDLIILWEENNGVSYSDKEVELANQHLEGEKEIADLPYSATKMGYVIQNTGAEQLLVPRLINNDAIASDIADGGIGQSFDFEPRILIYYGEKEGVSGLGLFRNSGGALVNTSYPFAYWIKNDSTNEDTSLAFRNYKDVAGSGFTADRGLYDRFYKETIRQINFGRLYIAWFKLTEVDILNLDFRKPIMLTINGNKTYFHLNRINDWLAGKDEPTEVELIQIAYGYGDNTE